MANRIQLRRGGAQEWANENPTLAQGEIGIELDTNRFKIGDGVRGWNTLPYERPIESVANTANTLVKRDADGNFTAGAITATLIGNSATSSRLANPRQIQLSQDLSGSGTFDGSSNLSLAAQLQTLTSLPHYDGTTSSSGQYTKVTVDAKGRITNASQPSSYVDLGLTDVQPIDSDLSAISNLTTTGIIARASAGNMQTRSVQGSSGRISVVNGNAVAGNPTLDLIDTTVALEAEFIAAAGLYNIPTLISVGGDDLPEAANRTVNSTRYTVDQYGRFTSALTIPIATAREGSKYAAYGAGVTYARYDIIEESSGVYQAIASIAAGQGAPTHTDASDAGAWRYLGAALTEQKGLASFAQEDFDVDSNGHVTIAAVGVDNTQLQNNRIGFADGNTLENFELDQELTATSGYRGFNYLNYVKVNDTSGNLLVGANNTGDSGAGELDVNVRSYFSDPDITLDGALNQTLDKTGDGDLTFQLTQDTASNRNFNILTTNAGSGSSNIIITAEDTIQINASEATGKVHVEDYRFQTNYLGTTDATMHLDPGDDRAITGTVRVWGNLQIDGVTTTINSTTLTVDDVTILLGGDTVPTTDDNLDRGIEFNYYDTEARLGFYGWDTSYTDLNSHGGGYRFLHAATNSSEVFTGTDSGIVAGNLKLTTNNNSTSNTTGDFVVAGGAGIGQDVNIGGLVDIDSTLRVHSTSRFDDNMVIQGASKTLQLNNGSGTTRVELQSTTGNASFYGVVDITNNLNINTDKFNVTAASGNTYTAGTLEVTQGSTLNGAVDLNNTLNVSSTVHFEATDEPTFAQNAGTGLWEIQSNDYGSFRFDGGGYIAGDFMFDSDVVINGTILQKESSTEVFNEQNFLRVRRKLESGSVQALNPSYANHTNSNLRIFGGAGIVQDLHIGDDLYIGKVNNGDTVEFTVLGESGNTQIGRSGAGTASVGTLTVYGDTLLDRDLTVNGSQITLGNANTDILTVNSDATFTDNLTVNQSVEFDSTLNVDDNVTFGAQLTVTGTTEFNNTVDVDANFAVRSGSTDKMTVASSSGNIATDGTLVVQGQTTINDSLYIQSSNEFFKIQNGSSVDKFTVDTDNGNTAIIGTLTVSNATQLNNTLGCQGIASFTNTTDQDVVSGSYTADGGVRITSGLGVERNLAVGGDTRFYGTVGFESALDVDNAVDISGNLNISNGNDVSNFTDTTVALKVSGGARISKKMMVGGDFTVYDSSGALNNFFVEKTTGNAELRNNLVVGGDLTVNGTTTTVNSTTLTVDDPIITLGGDSVPTTDDNLDRGVEFRYYDTQARLGFFGYDNNLNRYRFLVEATNSSETFSGTDASLQAGSLQLTSSGTGLDVDANANIDGTLTVDGQIISQVSSGPALVIPTTAKINNLNADLLDSMTTDSANTATTVVARDNSGDFAANQITVNNGIGAVAGIQGNATSADALRTARVITVDGVVNGNVSFDGSAAVTITTTYDDDDITALAAQTGTGIMARTAANTYAHRTIAVTGSGIGITNADGISGDPLITITSASTNSANNIVIRDVNGDFAAGTITATLVGDVTGDLTGNADNALQVSTGSGGAGGTMYFAMTNQYGAGSSRTLFANTSTITLDTSGGVGNNTLIVDKVTADLTGNVIGNVTGEVSSLANHDTADLAEGTNLYYTNARAEASFDTKIAAATTTDLTEGTNLYYTDERVDDRVGDLVVGGTGINALYDDGNGALTLTVTQGDIDTDNVTEGSTNIFYTEGRFDASLATKSTDQLTEGANLYYTNTRADDRVNLQTGTNLDLSSKSTSDLSEGTNQYYTEARVQTKLDNAFAQLQAMLTNLATTTTLTLNLSGDPTPGAAVTTLITNNGSGGFTAGTNVATTGGTGTSLTVDTTVDAQGRITAATVNTPGSDYVVNEVVFILNANAGKVLSLNLASLAGGSNYVTGTALATTGGSGSASLTVNITASAGAITNVTINDGGTGYVVGETITIVQPTGADGLNPAAGGTVDVATIATNAGLQLTDVTTMELGAVVTGSESGTTGIITNIDTQAITVDTVDGFFKVGEVVSANDVTTLTLSSFA
jgi:hypothetical protein